MTSPEAQKISLEKLSQEILLGITKQKQLIVAEEEVNLDEISNKITDFCHQIPAIYEYYPRLFEEDIKYMAQEITDIKRILEQRQKNIKSKMEQISSQTKAHIAYLNSNHIFKTEEK